MGRARESHTRGGAHLSPCPRVDRTGWSDWVGNMTIGGRFGLSMYNIVGGAAATASYWGLGMQAYEAGPDTVEGIDTGAPLAAKAAASIDPRISPIIASFFLAWGQYGTVAEPMNYYTAGAGPLMNPYGIYSILCELIEHVLCSAAR